MSLPFEVHEFIELLVIVGIVIIKSTFIAIPLVMIYLIIDLIRERNENKRNENKRNENKRK